jgi:hypothetical protein
MTTIQPSEETRTLTFVEPPEPEGAVPPNLGVVHENTGSLVDGDPFFFTEAIGDVQVDIGEALALEFRQHRPGQVGSLLRSTHMEDLTTVFVHEGAIDADDFDALKEARINHLRLGVNTTSWKCTEGSLELPDGSDLSSLTSVRRLEIRGVKFSGDHLESLGSRRTLESLELHGATIPPTTFGLFTHLRGLYVNGDATFGSDVAFLDRLPHLEAIGIRFSGLTQADLPEIVGRVQPWLFDIAYNEGIGPDLSALADARQISLLDVSRTGADDTTIGTLPGSTKLSILKMQCTDLTDRGLEALRALPQITHLNIAGTHITDAGLHTIVETLPRLRTLDIRATDTTAEGAKVLSNLKHLWRLGLSDPLLTVDYATHMRYEGSVTELIVGVGMFEMNEEQSAAFEVFECGRFPGAPA